MSIPKLVGCWQLLGETGRQQVTKFTYRAPATFSNHLPTSQRMHIFLLQSVVAREMLTGLSTCVALALVIYMTIDKRFKCMVKYNVYIFGTNSKPKDY